MLPLLAVVFLFWTFWRDWRGTRLHFFDYGVLRLSLIYCRLWHRWGCNRTAPFQLDRGCLIICNHTCSADPMFLLAGCHYPIAFGVAWEHFYMNPIIHAILAWIGSVPIRRGGHDPVAVRRILRVLERGRNICLFPEGNLSGVERGRLGAPRHGAAYLALKSRAPVYPVFISGGPRTDALLASWVWPSPRAVKVVFGPPVDLSPYRGQPLTRKLIEEVSRLFMRRIQELSPRKNPDFVPHVA